jgi:sugar phosphate isomerase/epimerase
MRKYNWEKGISLSFFTDHEKVAHGLEESVLKDVYSSGFRAVELSFSHDDYFKRFALHTEKGISECRSRIENAGLRVWSLHLPFSEIWDLSNLKTASLHGFAIEDALKDDMLLVHACALLGGKIAVIHPSFEPIPLEERSLRIAAAKNNLRMLNEYAKEQGVQLALENLPRTCLGNTSEEMLKLLDATGAAFIFDTNHSLQEDNIHFLTEMINAGYCPVSLHISDYDFVDERHEVPGKGINKWGQLMDMLQSAGYSGPAMYEIRHIVNENRVISLDEVVENIDLLLDGKLSE